MVPENAVCRSERRRRSGVRAALIWGGVLLLGLTVYLAAYGIIGHFQTQRWSRSINAAVRSSDAETLAALLTACKREMPAMAKRPEFAIWQKHLLAIQEKNLQRHRIFEQKLADLKALADSDDSGKSTLELKLAEVARFASSTDELDRLRELQIYCETLTRNRELASAQTGAAELKKVAFELEKIDSALKNNRLSKVAKAMENAGKKLSGIIRTHQKFPAVIASADQLHKKLEALQEKFQLEQKKSQLAANAFAELVSAGSPEKLEQSAKNFLTQYAPSTYAAQVKALMQALELLQQDHKQKLNTKIHDLEKRNASARTALRKAFENIAGKNLRGLTSELVVQDPSGKIHFFETYEKPLLQKSNLHGIENMQFTDLDKVLLKVRFSQNNTYAEIVLPGNKNIAGKVLRPLKNHTLPETLWQQIIFDYNSRIDSFDAMQFIRFIAREQKRIQAESLLDPTVKKELEAAFDQAVKILRMTPEQFEFELEILKTVAANTPVFAGINLAETPADSSCWQLDIKQKNPFVLLEKSQKPGKNLLLAVPEHGADYARLVKLWQDRAAQHHLQIPELPAFVPVK